MATDTTSDTTPGAAYLDRIADEVTRVVAVIGAPDPEARLVTYPGYQVGTLGQHLGSILTRSEQLLRTGELPDYGQPVAAPAGVGLGRWVGAAADAFLATARSTDPDREVPSYPHGQLRPARSVLRTVVTELALHRWDLESASGNHGPVDTALAVDLIDSVFEIYAPNAQAGRRVGLYLGGTVALEATDAGVAWQVAVDDHGVLSGARIEPGLAADATLGGPAQALLIAVWKRTSLAASGLTVTGDPSLVERFLRIPYLPDPQTTAAH